MTLDSIIDLTTTEFPRPLAREELPKFLIYLCEKTGSDVRGREVSFLNVITPEPGHERSVDYGSYSYAGTISQLGKKSLKIEGFEMKPHNNKADCLGSFSILTTDDDLERITRLDYMRQIKFAVDDYFKKHNFQYQS